jgi:hypothetical protein
VIHPISSQLADFSRLIQIRGLYEPRDTHRDPAL